MSKLQKGDYGYLEKYKKNKLLGVLTLGLMIIFIVVTVIIMLGDTKRVAIVFAILLSLPFAKTLIAYIMVANFKPLTKTQHKEFVEDIQGDKLNILYDVVIVQYEGMKFYQLLLVKNGRVYAYTNSKDYKSNKKDYEKWISNAYSASKYEYKVFLTDDLNAYIKKIKSISEPNDNTRIIDKHIMELILEKGV